LKSGKKYETTVSKPSFSFPRERKLKGRKTFEKLFKDGRFSKAKHLYLVSGEAEDGWQIAVVARKKDYPLAVSRNRVKRRLREAVRLDQADYRPFRGVVVAKRGLLELGFTQLRKEWRSVCEQAGVLKETVPPARPSLGARFLIALVLVYRKCISPLFPPCCRFTPTCSQYALEALEKHGFFKGAYLAARRILRCNPYNPGGYDPVP